MVGILPLSSRVCGACCLRQPETAASPLADSAAALERQQSASCKDSRQSNGRFPYRSPPSNGYKSLQTGQSLILGENANHESPHGGASPAVQAPPEGVREENSPLWDAKSMFHLSPSYDSEDGGRALHSPVLTGRESPPGPTSPPCLSLPKQCVLAPRIVVTPEYRAVDEGVATV
jgi:hypothetical protein